MGWNSVIKNWGRGKKSGIQNKIPNLAAVIKSRLNTWEYGFLNW